MKLKVMQKPRASYRRESAEDRRRQLGEAALRCIQKSGSAGVSVRQIATEAGVTQGLITHHFGEINELIAFAFDIMAADLHSGITAAIDAAPDHPRARMEACIEASFSPEIFDQTTLAVWIVFWGLVLHSPKMSAAQQRDNTLYVSRMERLIGDLAGVEGFKVLNIRLAAVQFAAMFDGLWLNWCLNPQSFSREDGITLCRNWVEGLRRGAYA
nr:TetR family transcriptional regulator C-terminal domain-containing protein [uncultured Gellertiella sp.]